MDWHIKIRLFSLLFPLTLIGISAFIFPLNTNNWIFLLVVAMVLGYTHFFVGTVYQLKGISRDQHKIILLTAFLVITFLSFTIGQILIASGYAIALGMFTLTYFVLHVLLNEHTFLGHTPYKVSYPLVLSLLLLFVPPFLMSLTHPSFFYSFDLTYPIMTREEQLNRITEVVSLEFLRDVSTFLSIIFVLVAPFMFYRRFGVMYGLIIGGLGLGSLSLVGTNQPINFVYMVHGVLVFHFILLSLIFYHPIKSKGTQALREFILLHIGILLPLLLLVAAHYIPTNKLSSVDDIFSMVFDFGFFLTISLTHISVSFLNESWFKKYLICLK